MYKVIVGDKAMSPDQLNQREHEILERLSTGLSDQEIAADLFLSLNTIKWYNRQIYSKLGVSNRVQAIAHARALGLLQQSLASGPFEADRQLHALQHRKLNQQIHFTNSFDGTRIAYSIAGEGPPFVKTAAYMCHLEFDWDSPVFRHWLEEFTQEHTLIRYDERGTGLSDWAVEDLSFEAWVQDLEVVVEATGLERFTLFAQSQGGTVAIAYAARHPDKVSNLILFGSYARGWLQRDLTPEQYEEEHALITLMKVGWGRDNPAFRQVFATNLIPDGPPELIRELEKMMRVSTTAENALHLETTMHSTNVIELAKQIRVPTLVIHSIDDGAVPFEEGRLLASLIPGAEFVALKSKNHLLRQDEPAWEKFVEAMRRFLSE